MVYKSSREIVLECIKEQFQRAFEISQMVSRNVYGTQNKKSTYPYGFIKNIKNYQ